ncbi:SDR family NAD(P)-dependent oxidoreductase [Bordetella sp. BOR01]|uniref:SDR family NAD(P)-dependent oxidoreductase n=1 Tax=Bordetella sp. BOR01 TaxID=2854779 RepID=UPI001C48E1FE|nr:SDR family oxidoreductase [Bordetella sp. BOR01]MBV7484775.1 SDR family oxidoreductase [Bordetella sp. BOR01]
MDRQPDRAGGAGRPVTVVTGAAGGIGRELVHALLDQGHHVLAVVRRPATFAGRQQAGQASLVQVVADLTAQAGRLAVVQAVQQHFGGLTSLVNNAGIGMGSIRPDYYKRPVQLAEIDAQTLQRFLDVNAHAPIALALALLPWFNLGWGRIINVGTSLTAMLRPGFLPYAMSKAALESASAVLAEDLRGTPVTVNVLNPGGPVDTPMARREEQAYRAALIAPALMAPPVCWLASAASGGMHGRRVTATRWHEAAAMDGTDPVGWPQLANDSTWAAAPSCGA